MHPAPPPPPPGPTPPALLLAHHLVQPAYSLLIAATQMFLCPAVSLGLPVEGCADWDWLSHALDGSRPYPASAAVAMGPTSEAETKQDHVHAISKLKAIWTR